MCPVQTTVCASRQDDVRRGRVTEPLGVGATFLAPAGQGDGLILDAQVPAIILRRVCSFISIPEVQTQCYVSKIGHRAGGCNRRHMVGVERRGDGRGEEKRGGQERGGEASSSLCFHTVGHRTSQQAESS